MKKLLYAVWVIGLLFLAPALMVSVAGQDGSLRGVAYGEAGDLEDGEGGDGGTVIIEEEEVPLSAIPMVDVPQGIASQRRFYIIAGGILMLASSAGILWMRRQDHREA